LMVVGDMFTYMQTAPTTTKDCEIDSSSFT
jgi:hypothetical protein